ncbi:MAG TPA: pitrilysin family protein [Gemmataceae bacterium]|nr:pitrilysin family protein [Gemmataceae bacterium]
MNRPRQLGRCLAVAGLLALAVCLIPGACRAEPAAPQKVVSIEGITEYHLDNGLRVLLFPDGSTPTVTVNLTVLVGSRTEGYGEMGMAHLLEHMSFKGTPRHPNVPKSLRDHGARFNGTTWVDRTNYFETMPATDENLEFAIDLEADRLVNSYVKREDLLSEMTVVRNEFEQGENNPENILGQRLLSAAYQWHNYGHSTIGNRSDIERVPIDRLQAFYHKYYQPDNAVLVVAGNFEPEKALALVRDHFGAVKRPGRRLETTYTEEPPQDGEHAVVLRRVGTVAAAGAVYHIPAGAHADFAPMEVLATMLTSQPSGRLYKALVKSRKATYVSATAYNWHDPGVLEVMAQVEHGVAPEEVRDALVSVLEALPAEQFTAAEVDRARRKLLNRREELMRDPNRVAVTLSDWAAKGDWRLFFLHRDRIAKVTPADVARVAGRYLLRSNRTAGVFLPTEQPLRAAVPETPPAAELVKNYQGGKDLTRGEAFEPTPENVEKRVERVTLPSGVKAALLPKKSRGQGVIVELTLRYGSAGSLKGRTSAAQLLGTLMTRGTKHHTRQQLEDEADKLHARLQGNGGTGEVSFGLHTTRANLPAALRLLGEVLREPTLPQDEFDVLKRQYREALEQGLKDPRALATRALQRKLSPYPRDDIRYVPTLEESIARLDAVTLDEVRRLYADQLGGQVGELVVVGDFDPQEVTAQLGDLLKDWKAGTPYERIPHPAVPGVKGERVVIETPDKANAVYLAALSLARDDADPDHAALEVGNFLFGGGSLSSRLGNRVRQKEGLSYGVGSHYTADSKDKSARFMLFAICNPANIGKVERAIREELETLLAKGVEEKELAEAKAAYLKGLRVQRSTDGGLAGMLGDELYAGRTSAYYAELEKKVAALTVDEVNAALKKALDPKGLVIIEAGDFRKNKTGE